MRRCWRCRLRPGWCQCRSEQTLLSTGESYRMCAQTISESLNRLDYIVRTIDWNEVLSTTFHNDVFLARVVNANNSMPDSASGELYGEMPKTAACAGYNDPASGFCVRLAQGRIDGYACAKKGRCRGRGQGVGDGRYVVCGREGVSTSAQFLILRPSHGLYGGITALTVERYLAYSIRTLFH